MFIITLISLSALFLITNCGTDTAKNETNTVSSTVSETDTLPLEATEEIEEVIEANDSDPDAVLVGTWVGEMNSKKLVVVIKYTSDNKLGGFNFLGKNERPLKGTFVIGSWDQPCSKAYEATLAETW